MGSMLDYMFTYLNINMTRFVLLYFSIYYPFSAKLVPLAYGIKKLQICCVVVDDLVGTDFLEEEIYKFDELVQSVDIAAFNKI